MKTSTGIQLVLFCLTVALTLAGCAAGPMGAFTAMMLSLLLGMTACYSTTNDGFVDPSTEGVAGTSATDPELPDDGKRVNPPVGNPTPLDPMRNPPTPDQTDRDGDGYDATEDCNDTNAAIHPGAIDNDPCDSIVWDCAPVSCNAMPDFYVDADGDGYYNDTDCNDSNAAIHPNAIDPDCDGIDNNCSGGPELTCNPIPDADLDADGYLANLDCNDNDPSIHPNAYDPNECDGIDENCDQSEWACNSFEDAGTDNSEQ